MYSFFITKVVELRKIESETGKRSFLPTHEGIIFHAKPRSLRMWCATACW